MRRGLRTSFGLFASWLALTAVLGPQEVCAQQTGTIRGRVLDMATGRPLPSVQVFVAGTGTGALSNQDGGFVLANVAAGQATVRAQLVGYGTESAAVEVVPGEVVELEFELQTQAISLDEVVVTGTGAPARRRQLGQTIESITAQDLETAPITSVTDALQGRVPGMTGLAMGETGAAGKLLLRGTVSLSQRNEPLIYVDGVRWDNTRTSVSGVAWDRLGDINPADIERIEVIKGAAAATLFGTEASSGVIQIFTKRGTAQEPVFTFQMDQQAIHLPHSAWPENVQYNPATQEIMRQRPAEDFVTPGHHQNYTISVRGGSPAIQFYVSGRVMHEDGPLPNNALSTASVRSAFDFTHGERLRSTVDVSVVRSALEAPQPDWSSVASDFLLSHPIRATESDPHGRSSTGEFGIADLLSDKYDSNASNVVVSGSLSYDFPANVVATLRVGHNDVRRKDVRFRPERVVSPDTRAIRRIENVESYSTTVDASLTWNSYLTERLQSNLTLGGQGFWEGSTNEVVQGAEFASPTLSTLRGASVISSVDEFQQQVINAGLFAQGQIGLDDRLFLTAGLRMDGNSAFGEDFGLTTYPKAGLSWVISDYDFFRVPGVNELRIRGAIGTSGLQPGAFDAWRTWQPGIYAGDNSRVTPLNLGNQALKPERSTEQEIALEAGLFDGRVGLEAIFFNQTTSDALLPVSPPSSGGFLQPQLINIGEMKSKGVELMTEVQLVNGLSFGWDLNAAYTWIDQKVTDMGGIPDIRIEGRRRWGWIKEGYRPGAVLAPIQDPDEPYILAVPPAELTSLDQVQANVVTNPDGSEKLFFIGNSLPSWTIDFGTTFRFGQNLRLRALFTGAGGFVMSNETASLRGAVRINEHTAIPESILQDPNATAEEKLAAADAFGRQHHDVLSSFMEPGDWLKLNELTLTYELPEQLLSRLGLDRTTVSVGGRRLLLWTKYSGIIDPGTSGGGFTGVSEFLQNIDYISAPSPRRYTLTVRTTW